MKLLIGDKEAPRELADAAIYLSYFECGVQDNRAINYMVAENLLNKPEVFATLKPYNGLEPEKYRAAYNKLAEYHEHVPDVPKALEEFLQKVKRATERHADVIGVSSLMENTVEELGEYAKACAIESGRKEGELKESSKEEGVDVVICAFSLYFKRGGTVDHFLKYGTKKLDKWETNIERREQEDDRSKDYPF